MKARTVNDIITELQRRTQPVYGSAGPHLTILYAIPDTLCLDAARLLERFAEGAPELADAIDALLADEEKAQRRADARIMRAPVGANGERGG